MAVLFEYATLNGGERSMLAVFDQLADSDFEFVAIATPEGPLVEALQRRGIRQLPLELHDAKGMRLSREESLARLTKLVRDAKAEIVHANSLSMGRLLGAASADLDIPTAAHLRDIVGLSRAAVEDLNRVDRLIVVSKATRNLHLAQGLDDSRVRVIHNGVDCTKFSRRPRGGLLRRTLGLSDDTFRVLTIGQIGPRKGWDVLADAAAAVSRSLPNVHFLLVGERNSEKQESIEFERMVKERFSTGELAGRSHWLGRRDDVDLLMNEADLLVHPARQEPLGRVLLEAAASGLPILATNVGGTPEIIEEGDSGRLIPPNDPAALASVLIELHDDGAQRKRLAESARRRAEQFFSIERAAKNLAEIWCERTRI